MESNGNSISKSPIYSSSKSLIHEPDFISMSLLRAKGTKRRSSALSADQLAECRAAFKLFDKDNDGTITAAEIGSVLQSIGVDATEEDLKYLLHDLDTDGDGTIDFEEFAALMSHRNSAAEDNEDMKDAFELFDKDGDGLISAEEMRDVTAILGDPLTDAELAELMASADVDGDGSIDFAEFVRLMNS